MRKVMLDLVGKSGKDVLEVVKEVALEAGDLLMRRFRSVLDINYKGEEILLLMLIKNLKI